MTSMRQLKLNKLNNVCIFVKKYMRKLEECSLLPKGKSRHISITFIDAKTNVNSRKKLDWPNSKIYRYYLSTTLIDKCINTAKTNVNSRN